MRTLSSLLVVAALAGCANHHNVEVSWFFATARTCSEAGVATVTLAATGGSLECSGQSPCTVSCSVGTANASITVQVDPDATSIDLTAQSAAGEVLYEGSAPVTSSTPSVMITLNSTTK
jgi:hypothetical protein